MSVLFIHKVAPSVSLGLWETDAPLDETQVCPGEILPALRQKCRSRRQETASVYALLHSMLDGRRLVVGYAESGRPLLDGYNIGISHTDGYASVILSADVAVSVDIERRSGRVLRIADRFLRADEMSDIEWACRDADNDYRIDITLLYWCAKETVFKYYSDSRLTFQNMRVWPFSAICGKGSFRCANTITGESVTIWYIRTASYVLTYSFG